MSVVALGFAAAPYVSSDVMGRNVRAYLLKHPEVLDEVVAARQSREDGARVQTTNAAVAAKLRHSLPTLEALLVEAGWPALTLRVKVQSTARR